MWSLTGGWGRRGRVETEGIVEEEGQREVGLMLMVVVGGGSVPGVAWSYTERSAPDPYSFGGID